MSPLWLAAIYVGLAAFLTGLVGAAWRGQTPVGQWRPGAWRWLVVAAGGLALWLAGLRLVGTNGTGIHYPLP